MYTLISYKVLLKYLIPFLRYPRKSFCVYTKKRTVCICGSGGSPAGGTGNFDGGSGSENLNRCGNGAGAGVALKTAGGNGSQLFCTFRRLVIIWSYFK